MSHQQQRRNRTRSMDDSYYSYSDSFASDSDKSPVKQKKKSSNNIQKSYGNQKSKSCQSQKGKSQVVDTRKVDQITQRMLSAKRLKINDLKNENEELRQLLDEARDETRTLKTSSKRQEKALLKFESREGELPSLIDHHNSEVRSLKEHLRRYRGKVDQSRRQYHDLSDELHKSKCEAKRLKQLVEQKGLRERDDLDRRLTDAEIELDQKEKRIGDLERHVEHINKNHRHEMAIEIHRHKETKSQLDSLLKQNFFLEREISAKRKVLDVNNIYSNRGSGVHRPLSPASSRKPMNSDLESLDLGTPRDKAERSRKYEARRREKIKKKKQKATEKETIEETEHDDIDAKELNFSFTSVKKEPTPPPDKSDEEFIETKKQCQSPKIPESYEPTLSPPPKTPSPSPPPKEPTPTPPPPPPSPSPKLATPPRSPSPEPIPEESNEAEIERHKQEALAQEEQRRKKDILLARLRALDEKKEAEEEEDVKDNSKSQYSFSKPVDNLHHGLPAHHDVKVPYLERQKRRLSLQNDTKTKENGDKKKDLMNTLFGDTHSDGGDDRPKKVENVYSITSTGYQPTTDKPSRQVISKPVINAVDEIREDEIEELIL